MSLKKEFNRITRLFDDSVARTEKQTAHWLDEGARRATQLKRRVRHQVDTGRRGVVGVEDAFVRHMRENPGLYLIGAALLIGALVARLLLEARRPPRAPLL